MVETGIFIAIVVAVAIVLFILTDKAGQPNPIPLIKLVILLVALIAIANRLGYA